ncbi:sensor histidine kinase [Spirosoma luteum]|uniref:sensor histidine kinase n=1 Tax=Spirosoma luteum TaxID=431553 RepID=UPI000374A024|nr:ATP-binding protein [Spirosoma luteum]
MNRFAIGIGWRIGSIILLVSALTYYWLQAVNGLLLFPLAVALLSIIISLYRFVTSLNRKLTRFLESVRYSDFAVAFRADSNLGPSFHALNSQFNEVLDAFRQARAEKEANLHYVNTIVQHVGVGLLTFDATGQVELVNQSALRLLGIYRLRTLNDLDATHSELSHLLSSAKTSSTPVSYQTGTDGELSVRCTSVRLRGRLVTVVSLQNIRTELQQRELEAWQNLTKVLRHEIMNSITPIVSLAGTMRDIVEIDLMGEGDKEEGVTKNPTLLASSPLDDLRDALTTIEQRGEGIMRFVDAYRNFTTIPQPVFSDVPVDPFLRKVCQLAKANAPRCQMSVRVASPNLVIRADAAQIEMVLLNLIKNAVESLGEVVQPTIQIEAESVGAQVIIRVIDNGPGIEPEAMEQIFIPFYTTKKTGSGIGLSLSRQIMQLHNGQLTALSTPEAGSTFSLSF